MGGGWECLAVEDLTDTQRVLGRGQEANLPFMRVYVRTTPHDSCLQTNTDRLVTTSHTHTQ